jgi:hypothetical protein
MRVIFGVCGGGECHINNDMTNLRNEGLISADRRTKPTLMLTIPRSLFKSSTKDLSFPIFGIVIQRTHQHPFCGHQRTSQSYDAGPEGLPLLASHRER